MPWKRLKTGDRRPPPWCRVGRSLNQLFKVGALPAPLGFSVHAELAHQSRTRAPVIWVLGQRASSNHEHGRGDSEIVLGQRILAKTAAAPIELDKPPTREKR